MKKVLTEGLEKVIHIDDARVREHLGELVRGSVEETLNAMLDAEADHQLGAARYERVEGRKGTRAGHYQRKLQTKAGEVTLQVPKLRKVPFETAIIERTHPYVYLDGIYLKRSWGGEVRNVAIVVAIGVADDGYREILGVAEGAKEDRESWTNFLRHLKGRGLRGVELVISDKCLGLVESLGEFYPEARWQRCVVHFYRNVFTVIPRGRVREVASMLKAIHAQEDRREAEKKARSVATKLRAMKLVRAAEVVETGASETLSYYAFPEEHWLRVRTNNPLERILREVRRRTRVVGAFPDGQSALMLVAARLRHIAGSKWGTKKYLDTDKLKEVKATTKRSA